MSGLNTPILHMNNTVPNGEGLGLTGINGAGGGVHGTVLHSAVHEVEFAPTGEVSPHLPSHSADNFYVMQKGDSFVDAVGFDGTGKLGSKVVEELGSSPLRQDEGIRWALARKGDNSSMLPDLVAREIKVVPPQSEVGTTRLVGGGRGSSPKGGGIHSQGGGHWKMRAREKMVVDEGVAGVVLRGKRTGPFGSDLEDQVFKKSKSHDTSMDLEVRA
ncbi:hypothetical protein ACOSQ2_023621 [Xanthoceras sorbifolium]